MDLAWRTPEGLVRELEDEFGPCFDPCPPTPTFDGLTIPWISPSFVNPPYGREISAWMAKAWQESRRGVIVVALIPSRTDTAWFHEYVMRADELRFLRGRIHFEPSSPNPHGIAGLMPAPFPSALVVWRGVTA